MRNKQKYFFSVLSLILSQQMESSKRTFTNKPNKWDNDNYRRRIAARDGIPFLTDVKKMNHVFFEMIQVGHTNYRRFYVQENPGNPQFYCYIPTPQERTYGELPVETQELYLYAFNKLKAFTSNKDDNVVVEPSHIMAAVDVFTAPDFMVTKLRLAI